MVLGSSDRSVVTDVVSRPGLSPAPHTSHITHHTWRVTIDTKLSLFVIWLYLPILHVYPHWPCCRHITVNHWSVSRLPASVLCAVDKIRTRFFSPLSTPSRGVLCVLGLGCILFTSVVFQFVKYLSAATLIPKSDLLSQKHTGTFLFRLNYGRGGEESSLYSPISYS